MAAMAAKNYSPSTSRPTFPSSTYTTPRKIALEEAISTNVFDSTNTLPPAAGTAELPYVDYDYVRDIRKRLSDIDARVEAMDRAGVTLTIVSLTMPGIQGIFDTATAVKTAKEVNDETYNLYTAGKFASRFRALGCLPMQDPAAAATEAERCVKELGFLGVLVNGFSNIGSADSIRYLDDPINESFWTKMEDLDVPFYLHPRIPPPSQMRAYQDYEFLAGSPWGFGVETAIHAIRLMISGLFDRHPQLKIVLGHCGEGLPFSLYRIDARIRHFRPEHLKCKLRLQDYWEKNFWITTAGVKSDATFAATLKSCGEDRIMWSVDYPYEDYDELGEWFDRLELNEHTRSKIGWENCERLFGLSKSLPS